MAEISRIAQALVRFWDHPHNRDPRLNYVCSGVFIAKNRILTVEHAFDGGRTLWAEPRFAGQAYALVGSRSTHPRHDAACVDIEVMPANARWLELDPTTQHAQLSTDCTLDGFWRSGEEHVRVQVLNFAPDKNWFITTPKHPQGHSGSALCHLGKVWAIAVEHFADPNTDRGCVLAIQQLWHGWLDALVPGPAVVHVDPPPPVSDARKVTVAQLRTVVHRLFSHDLAGTQPFVELVDGLPKLLAEALAQADPKVQGSRAAEAVIRTAEALLASIKRAELTLAVHSRLPVRDALFEAMGRAARLCLDLDRLPGSIDADTHVIVPARLPEGATLALRASAHKCWALDLSDGISRLRDPRLQRVRLELGEGQPRLDAMTRLAYRSVAVGGTVPVDISDDALMWLRGELNNLRLNDQTHCFIVSHSYAADQAMQDWAQHYNVCLIALQPAAGLPIFLMEEALLLGRVKHFVSLFDNKDWSP